MKRRRLLARKAALSASKVGQGLVVYSTRAALARPPAHPRTHLGIPLLRPLKPKLSIPSWICSATSSRCGWVLSMTCIATPNAATCPSKFSGSIGFMSAPPGYDCVGDPIVDRSRAGTPTHRAAPARSRAARVPQSSQATFRPVQWPLAPVLVSALRAWVVVAWVPSLSFFVGPSVGSTPSGCNVRFSGART